MFTLLSRRLPGIVAALWFLAGVPLFAQQPAVTPPLLPDPKLTPGDTLDVALADIQEKGYSSRVRNVPVAVKREVYAAYGITHWEKGEYEIDHLIALSLGGSNSKKNLWPQSYLTQPWNAHVKDQLEYRLLSLVRAGKVDLHTAQQEMARDWIAAYKQYVSPTPLHTKPKDGRRVAGTGKAVDDEAAFRDEDPDTETAGAPGASPAAGPAASPAAGSQPGAQQVWVNTKSGVIWRPGSRYYGKTKEGKYMSAPEAEAAGYHYAQ